MGLGLNYMKFWDHPLCNGQTIILDGGKVALDFHDF